MTDMLNKMSSISDLFCVRLISLSVCVCVCVSKHN